MDIVKTIDEDEEVQDLSEDSDVEVDVSIKITAVNIEFSLKYCFFQYQPTKQKRQKKDDFDNGFEFVSSVSEYNADTWDDLMKFVKRRTRGKVDDKIAKVIKGRKQEDTELLASDDEDPSTSKKDEEIDLSEDELKHDHIKVKKRKGKKYKKLDLVDENPEENEKMEFEEAGESNGEINSFYQMNLSRPLMKAIGVLGYIYPTPIQTSTIPIALLGRDICGCAATGTGKTAAYMLPTLERLLYKPLASEAVTRVLVLVPTRELGAQVYQVTKQLCQFTNIDIGLAIGGLDLKAQEAVLRQNPDVVIATPGRLIDHIKNTPSFTLDSIEVS